jgi:hypothetical protein
MKASVRRAGVQPKSSLREATVNTPDRAVAKPVSKAMKPLLVEVMAAVPAAAPVDTRVEDLQAAVEAFTVRVGQLESAASAPTVGRRWGRRS